MPGRGMVMWRFPDILKMPHRREELCISGGGNSDHAFTQRCLQGSFSLKAKLGLLPRMLHLGSTKPSAKTFPRLSDPSHARFPPGKDLSQVWLQSGRHLGEGEWPSSSHRAWHLQNNHRAIYIPFCQGQPSACCLQIGQSLSDKVLPANAPWKNFSSSFSSIQSDIRARSCAGIAESENRTLCLLASCLEDVELDPSWACRRGRSLLHWCTGFPRFSRLSNTLVQTWQSGLQASCVSQLAQSCRDAFLPS